MAEAGSGVTGVGYAFLDRCGLEIRGLSAFALKDLNEKFRGFLSPTQPASRIRVEIGPFAPDLSGCTNVDHQYFIRRNYAYFQESLPECSFQAEIRGLEEDITEVRFHLTGKAPFRPSRLLYPDAALHAYVLQPLLECKLSRHGLFLMHAGAVAKEGKAILFVGRGGSFKTTYCFRHVREGCDFLGDDLVMFDGEKVYPFPIHASLFDHYLRMGFRSESDLKGLRKAWAVPRLISPPPLSYRISGPAVPEEILVIHPRREWQNPSLESMSLERAVEKTHRNNAMERSSSVPSKYVVGNFLNAYGLIFPDHCYSGMRDSSLASLRSLLAGSRAYLLQTGTRWNEENLAAIGSRSAAP